MSRSGSSLPTARYRPAASRTYRSTGAAIIADENRALATEAGEKARVFITEVGFVAATVVRQTGQFLAVHFDLPPCVERDLLIRKLFTAGLDATTVNASAFSSTARC